MAELGGAVDRLVERLKAIPDGEVAATARRAEIGYRQLMKLRAGKNADIRLSTLEKLARGMRTTMADLLGENPQAPRQVDRAITAREARSLERVRRAAATLAEAAEDLAAVRTSRTPSAP